MFRTLPTYETRFAGNTITVPVTNFDNSTFNIVRDDNAPYDIFLVKESPLGYYSLLLKCSYDEKPLDPTPAELVCPVCGSIYNFDGTVKKGPAESPLSKFATELSADATQVTINIEALNR
ncbi:MAG: hypothetical protein WDO14_04675 [Bacteroidota bacterium]